MNIKKLIVKAAVTFVEAAVAALLALHGNFSKVALAGAIGSALSVVWNVTVYPALANWLKS